MHIPNKFKHIILFNILLIFVEQTLTQKVNTQNITCLVIYERLSVSVFYIRDTIITKLYSQHNNIVL